jgi:nucleotide-binding universal stress UspA family protein
MDPFFEAALPYAESIAKAIGRKLRLLRAVSAAEHIPSLAEALKARLEIVGSEAAGRYLCGLSTELQKRGLEVEAEVTLGTPAIAILQRAHQEDVGLILMATHGRGGISRWRLGSVADKVSASHPARRCSYGRRMSGRRQLPSSSGICWSRWMARSWPKSPWSPRRTSLWPRGAKLTLVRVVPSLRATMEWGGEYVPEFGVLDAEMAAPAKSEC